MSAIERWNAEQPKLARRRWIAAVALFAASAVMGYAAVISIAAVFKGV